MAKLKGFRFHPTDYEIFDPYLLQKNLKIDTSNVDEVISTVDICSFDPWELPSQSKIKSEDQTWYFYCRKENKYNRGDRQNRKTKSGFWKKTGVTMDIMRKSGNHEKIGEKRVLMFQFSKNQTGYGSKSGWVMHEYDATLSSPNQMMRYTICKVKFKGERRETSGSSGSEIQNIHSLIPHTNPSGGLCTGFEGLSFNSQELQNPIEFIGCLDEQQEAQLQDAMRAFNDIPSDDWKSMFNGVEQSKNVSMQENYNHYIPQKPLAGVFDDSDDDVDDLISVTTKSIQTSSICDSFASSNHGIDQIKTLQSPDLSIKSLSLTQEVSQETKTGENKLGQETMNKKKARFFNRMMQKLVKKVHLCSSISRS